MDGWGVWRKELVKVSLAYKFASDNKNGGTEKPKMSRKK